MIYEKDVHIHGGVVGTVNAHGNVIMHGGVVEKLNAQGSFKQYGGIIEQPVVYRDNVIYKDRIVYKDKIRFVSDPAVEALKLDNKRLRKELDEKVPSDDVLVARIESLEAQLKREREKHRLEVEDLKERIDVAMEINARLRKDVDGRERSQMIADEHIDILATLLSLYPFTADKDIVFEFGIPKDKIRGLAQVLGVVKSAEARREAVEYLRKQHIEFIQRRGGDQRKKNGAMTSPCNKRKQKKMIKNYGKRIDTD